MHLMDLAWKFNIPNLEVLTVRKNKTFHKTMPSFYLLLYILIFEEKASLYT